ncbi:MAG: DNA polymerase III subunit gamma/tau [gamma proteobacterium symbiont of Taylorina sp.]|nr:DNA polymerase III subunit gamma/tau [gamma proteobacterium symbiont of Taylorina sp.]
MKYQVLARKYRPKIFSTMVGQEHVLKALENALGSQRLHHAYLFTGTRGVGKTTVARVLAKALNCEQGITASPCGQCAACKEIDQGRFIDLIEVDAASRTKVEDTRDLLDNVQYAPSRGRFKIYLIDEVHMLSGHSFNALLKTLEEPPPHVKFLLATTDPQKLPATILSRCLQFNLKSLTIEQIELQLGRVLNEENITFDHNILKPLAIAADGSMRDGLSLLDQSIAYCDGKPNLTDIETMLGSVQKGRIFELLTALANEDGRALIEQSRILVEQGIDVNTVLAELITMLQRIALCQQVPDAIDDSLGDKNILEKIAQAISAEDIQLYYQIALNGRKDLPYSPQPRGGFEMILLRMLAFKPASVKPKIAASPLEEVQAEPENSPQENSKNLLSNKNQSRDSMPQDFDLPPVESYSQEDFDEPSELLLQHQTDQDPLLYTHEKGIDTDLKKNSSIEETPEKQYKSATASYAMPICDKNSDELAPYWSDLIERSQLDGLAQQLAKHCALISQSEQDNRQTFELLLESVHKHLLNDKMKNRLQEAIQKSLGSPVKIEIKECQLKVEEQLQTPRRREIQEAEILQQEAVKSILSDPNIDLLLSSFSAIVHEETIKPLDQQHTIH